VDSASPTDLARNDERTHAALCEIVLSRCDWHCHEDEQLGQEAFDALTQGMQGRRRVRVESTQLPQLPFEGVLKLSSGGFLLRRRQARIRPAAGDGPVIHGFDVLSPLLYVGVIGVLLFELVAIA